MKTTCIFISYSSGDRKLAEQIDTELSQLGYDVWRDQNRLELDWPREISQALVREADLVCLLWTKNAADSKWVQHEWLTARASEKRIIPCIDPDAPPLPHELRHLHGIQLEPDGHPARDIDNRLRANPALHVEYDFSIRSKNVYVPFRHNPAFVGRRDELAALYQTVSGTLDKTGTSVVGLVGMGGTGKTQLAIEFAFRYGFGFQAVYWIQAGSADRWFESLVHLARTLLKVKVKNPRRADADFQYISAMREYFGRTPRVLLILDNVEDPLSLASEQIMAGTRCPVLHLGCSVLFTTRTAFNVPGTASLPVGMMPPDASFCLLTRDREPSDYIEIEHAHVICSNLGYLALALVLANGRLRDTRSTYCDYRKDLAADPLATVDAAQMTEEELATRHEAIIEKTLLDQIVTLKDETARRLLKLSSLFDDAEWIPKDFLGHLGGIRSGKARVDGPLDHAMRRLLKRSLLDEVAHGDAVRLHPLLKAVIRKRMGPNEARRQKKQSSRRVAKLYRDFGQLEATYVRRGGEQLLLDLATAEVWGRESTGQAGDLYLLYRVISQVSADLRADDPDRAEASFSQQVSLRAVKFGLNDLKQKAEARRAELGGHRFVLRWAAGHGEPSLLRTIDAEDRGLGRTVALSADGQFAVTGGKEGTAIIWLVRLGVILHEFRPHEEPTIAITFLGSTRRFATASTSETIEVWNAETAEKVCSLPGNLGGVMSMAATPDGEDLLTACGDGLVRIWTLKTPPSARELSKDLRSMAAPVGVGCGGERVVVLYDDNTCRVIEIDNSGDSRQFECEKHTRILRVSGKGDYAILSGEGETALIVDLDTRATQSVVRAGHSIVDVALATDLAALSEFYGAVSVMSWPMPGTTKILLGSHGRGGGARLAMSPDGSALVSVACDGLKVWNPSEVLQTNLLRGHNTYISALTKRPGAPWFASASWDGTVKVWETSSGKMLRSMGEEGRDRIEERRDRIETLALGPAGEVIAGGLRETVIWDLKTSSVLKRLSGSTLSRMRYARDGSKIVSALFPGVVMITDPSHGTRMLGKHANQVLGLALVGNDKYAITGAGDGSVQRWDLEEFRADGLFHLHDDGVTDIAEVEGTPYVLAGCQDGSVKLLDWRNPDQVIVLRGKELGRGVMAVAASPSGRTVAAACGAEVLVWRIKRTEVLVRCTLWDTVSSLLMPEEDLLAVGDHGGRIYCLRIEN